MKKLYLFLLIGTVTGCSSPGTQTNKEKRYRSFDERFQNVVDTVMWLHSYRQAAHLAQGRYLVTFGKSWQDNNSLHVTYRQDSMWKTVFVGINNHNWKINCLVTGDILEHNPLAELHSDKKLVNKLADATLMAHNYSYNDSAGPREGFFEYFVQPDPEKSVTVWLFPQLEEDPVNNKGGGYFFQFDWEMNLLKSIIIPRSDTVIFVFPTLTIKTTDTVPGISSLYPAYHFYNRIPKVVIRGKTYQSTYTREDNKWVHIFNR